MSDLFRSPDAIVVLNDDETYTNINGCHVYLLHGDISAVDYDVSTFPRDVIDHPDIQVLSIERLVEFYLAFEAMNVHAFNVDNVGPINRQTKIYKARHTDSWSSDHTLRPSMDPTDETAAYEQHKMPEINDDDDDGVW